MDQLQSRLLPTNIHSTSKLSSNNWISWKLRAGIRILSGKERRKHNKLQKEYPDLLIYRKLMREEWKIGDKVNQEELYQRDLQVQGMMIIKLSIIKKERTLN